jgi:lipid-binding SYLF domain-containing protein
MTSQIRKRAALLGALVPAVGVISMLSADTVEAQNRRRDADTQRISDATAAFVEIASMQENGIPRAVLEKAEGIIIFPRQARIPRRRGQGPNTLRTARLLDISHRGILSVRNERGNWSPPAFLTLAGGSYPQDADLVLVIVNRSGLDNVMRHEFDVATTPTVAAGPVGNDPKAWTDSQRSADIFSYSRSRGVLTGVPLSGSVVQGDTIAHQRFYGKPLTTATAVAQTSSREPVPAWHSALEKHTRR